MAPRHLIAATVITALGFTLAGCSDDDSDAEPHDPFTVSVSPTDEPSEEPEKKLGPVQTVRAWVKAYNKMLKTGDAEEVYALSTPSCTTCENWIEPFVKIHRDGGKIDGYRWSIVDAKKHPEFAQNHTVVAGITYAAGTTWPSEGADPVSYDELNRIAEFALVRKGSQWLIADLTH